MAGRYKRPATPAERAAQDAAREEKLAALHQQLTEQIAALRTGDDWRAWLDVAGRFHTYSFNNTLLIYAQRPDARAVAGYTAWQALGRQVDKGEKGIQILAPVTRRPTEADAASEQRGEQPATRRDIAVTDRTEVDETTRARRVVGFRVAYVWDVGQTSGDPLPQQPRPQLLDGRAPDGLWDFLAAFVESRGFSVNRGDCGPANGWTDYTSRTVRIRADVDCAQAVKTLAHEVGHVLLHDPNDFASGTAAGTGRSGAHVTTAACRGVKEVEAESVAYLVGTSHGMATGSYTFPYVAGWAASVDADKPEAVVAAAGQRVLQAARTILDVTQDGHGQLGLDAGLSAAAEAGRERAASLRARAEATPAASTALAPAEDVATLIAIHEEATRWYAERLTLDPAGRASRAYLHDRGFDAAALEQFRVGYAPARWTGLVGHLRGCGFANEAIERAGLASRSSRGKLIDRFRDRIMFPVADEAGVVVGFIGRAVPGVGDGVPKYLNSPETPLYRKSELLYGLAQGREALAAGAQPVLVEGPLDAIAVAMACERRYVGVGSCGTSLSDAQAAALRRAVDSGRTGVTVALDGDHAGRSAAVRAYGPLAAAGFWPQVAHLGEGRDPADLARSCGPRSLEAALQDAAERPLADLMVDEQVAKWTAQLDSVEGRVSATRSAANVVAMLPQEHLGRQVARLAERLDLARGTVEAEVTHALVGRQPKGTTAKLSEAHASSFATPSRQRTSAPATVAAASYPRKSGATDAGQDREQLLRRADALTGRHSGESRAGSPSQPTPVARPSPRRRGPAAVARAPRARP